MNIKIISDSTCDLSPQQIAQYNITIVPLVVIKNNENFHDGIDITPEDIFSHVASGGALCSTTAINVNEYHEIFAKYAKDYDAVIHVNIGSGFSSCYQNACLAAEEFDNVYVIDSQNLSTGQGHVVLEACRMAETCTDIDAMVAALRDVTERVEASFLLSRLDYMVKGGRCSAVTALGANLLKLNPCIEVKNGKMHVGKKYRGKYAKCLVDYVRERLQDRTDLEDRLIFVTHTRMAEGETEAVKAAVSEYGAFAETVETTAGCTVSCHCGPGTLGILFIRSK